MRPKGKGKYVRGGERGKGDGIKGKRSLRRK